jgi:hypothetical protein
MSKTFRVAELDFDTIKSNLKDFFRNKGTFSDYDFEGSGLSLLIDVMAYNTHYNAIIANMLTQEMFLDTAVKRETVNLHAKRLGYLPVSMRAARAKVTVEAFPTNNPDTLILGRGAVFQSGGQLPFNFVTTDSITVSRNSEGRYIFSNVPLYEGRIEKFKYIVTPNQKTFQIPNKNVDISLLKVFVQTSFSSSELTEYKLYESIVEIDGQTNAYFLQINEAGYYEVSFGDDVIGKSITEDNVVSLEYVVCNGEIPNGAGGFSITDSIQGTTNIGVVTIEKAFGGAQAESLSSIKENASKRVFTQNRIVSISDYKPMIQQILNVGDVSVWGGENNSPPVYGKVFISILNASVVDRLLTSEEKAFVIEQLKSKMMVTVTPEIVDPEFVHVEINSSVYFDPFKTANSATQIQTIARTAIQNYVAEKLNKFYAELRNSNLTYAIDSADSSINSNITGYVLKRYLTPVLNRQTNYYIDMKNPIRESSDKLSSLRTNAFYVDGSTEKHYLEDDSGSIKIYKLIQGIKTDIREIGSIDYTTGKITILGLNVTAAEDGVITIRCLPLSNDIICLNNTALVVNDSDITVNVISESTLYNHTFTPSV